MSLLLVLPLVIPFTAAVLALVLWRSVPAQRLIAVVGATAHLIASLALLAAVHRDGVHAVQMGAWPAPFGITLVADLLGAIMLVLGSLMGRRLRCTRWDRSIPRASVSAITRC